MKYEFSDVKVNVDRQNETSDHPSVEYSEIEQHCSSDDIDLNKITKETLQVAQLIELLTMQVAKEDREVGNISFKIYWKYFVNGASAFVLILMALVFA